MKKLLTILALIAFFAGSASAQISDKLINKAKQGDAAAQFELAQIFLLDRLIPKDVEKAFFWMEKAAQQNLIDAQTFLGVMFMVEEQNTVQAVYWLTKAAEQNDVNAQYNLASIYLQDKNDPEDMEKGLHWMEKAANLNHIDAQLVLWYMFLFEKEDTEQAIFWLTKAAEQGDAEAQNELALTYLQDENIPKDIENAFFWMEKAAQQNHIKSQFLLGVMFLHEKNDTELAIPWLTKAAEQGDEDAIILLKELGLE